MPSYKFLFFLPQHSCFDPPTFCADAIVKDELNFFQLCFVGTLGS
jgi:hypothetical protein